MSDDLLDPKKIHEVSSKLDHILEQSEGDMRMNMTNMAKLYKMRLETLMEVGFDRAEAVIIIARRGLE